MKKEKKRERENLYIFIYCLSKNHLFLSFPFLPSIFDCFFHMKLLSKLQLNRILLPHYSTTCPTTKNDISCDYPPELLYKIMNPKLDKEAIAVSNLLRLLTYVIVALTIIDLFTLIFKSMICLTLYNYFWVLAKASSKQVRSKFKAVFYIIKKNIS